MSAPEFSRPIRIDTLGPGARTIEMEASAEERAALAERFGLISVESLAARVDVARSGDVVTASGRLAAAVVHACVATGEPVPESVDEPFAIAFHPQPSDGGSADEEIELGEAELDIIFYDSALVDIGEAVAETLSLSIDPYPRSPGAEEVLRKAGVVSEEDEAEQRAASGPFGKLAALKRGS